MPKQIALGPPGDDRGHRAVVGGAAMTAVKGRASAIMPEQAMRPEVISAVEDALEFHLGKLLGQAEATRHEIAVEIMRQVVCASYLGNGRK